MHALQPATTNGKDEPLAVGPRLAPSHSNVINGLGFGLCFEVGLGLGFELGFGLGFELGYGLGFDVVVDLVLNLALDLVSDLVLNFVLDLQLPIHQIRPNKPYRYVRCGQISHQVSHEKAPPKPSARCFGPNSAPKSNLQGSK